MRTPILAGNWKMQLGREASVKLAGALAALTANVVGREIIVAPSAPMIPYVLEAASGSNVKVAAQNCHDQLKGAFTGEWTAAMLAEIGCSHVIVGHSERRAIFGEKSDFVAKKALAAHNAGIVPIICVGETLEERDAGKTFDVVDEQTLAFLNILNAQQLKKSVIAYEPVWAIGTGRTATQQQAQEVHAHLRALIAEKCGADVADAIRILYGGSVTAENIDSLMAAPDIDGALVGGASLKPESFERIVKFK